MPRRILIISIGGIVIAEVIAMTILFTINGLPYYVETIIDASIMVAIVYPLLYFLLFKPLIILNKRTAETNAITQARLRLMEFSRVHELDELLQSTLDEMEILTGSNIGFFHFLDKDQNTLHLEAWSTNTIKSMCTAEGNGRHYDVGLAGVWADSIREKRPIIHNDYATLENKKGMPEGHSPVVRELTVPLMRDGLIVAIFGVGNKLGDYTDHDVEVVSAFADYAWDVIIRKQYEIEIRQSEQKFHAFMDWANDWEYWLGPDGMVFYSSASGERMTGYPTDQFVKDPDLRIRIVHEDDKVFFANHIRTTHNEFTGPIRFEFRMVTRDGAIKWISHECRALFDDKNVYIGRRVTHRDISEQKVYEEEIRLGLEKEKKLQETIRTMQLDIARDLHDTLGQNISYLRMNLEHLSESGHRQSADLHTKIQNMSKAANESYELVRGMLGVLQPGNSSQPMNIFTRYAEQINLRTPYPVEVISTGKPAQLQNHQYIQLFYIFREALNNIEKYANPSKVTSTFIWGEKSLTLEVTDDGAGFNPDQVPGSDHYGLKFMRERTTLLDGTFKVRSSPGKGTAISVCVPYTEILISTAK